MRATTLFLITSQVLLVASQLESRVDAKRCTWLTYVTCWYQGQNEDGSQVRCQTSGQIVWFARRAVCKDTYKGHKWDRSTCDTANIYRNWCPGE
ncbi:hypothetical protein PTTW11_10566 [Pyrenophora teres f. teres]|uniref:Uncharacterized protein n=1 Tax=Pyrenophora teres f. teres TaxID=97479 RepID=A0A6S6WDY4_9PLEO|nr:hypothetical protein PTTW11_10566 [Pyrenophora teres f. teres]